MLADPKTLLSMSLTCVTLLGTCLLLMIRGVAPDDGEFERCGIGPVLTGRIVGGNETEPNEWPWQASLQLTHPQFGKVGHWCGAVIIHKQWVMTAAHCILNPLFSLPQPVFWKVRVGEHNLKLTEGPEKTIQVSEVHFHPWYHAYDKDIALLKLEKELEFNDYVRAVCLPDEDAGYLGMRCIATGWGKVDFEAWEGHSPLFQTGIFGRLEGKTYRQGRKPVKFGANDSKRWNSKELKAGLFWRTGRKKQ
ncbi:Chymotrypsin-like elastase family member 1 [Araneus ventricosus]|uniref:Chymotrypsin-like elastase family member 1 n=1 Tax=Araneus ventricosus TaxID=182803 RepID=A0A4Y2MFM6_ARAVE|nr:Chymotrypsin-like elastase family member 1 [Araneus ventricosus]